MRFLFVVFGVLRGARFLDSLLLLEGLFLRERVFLGALLIVVVVCIRRIVPYSKTLR